MVMRWRSPNATYRSGAAKSYVPSLGWTDCHFSTFSGVIELTCAVTMAAPSVSRPENWAALSAAPTRKTPSKAVRSVGDTGAAWGGPGPVQSIASAPMSSAPIQSGRRALMRGCDWIFSTILRPGCVRRPAHDIQFYRLDVRGAAAHHDVEPPCLDDALHIRAVIGQVLRPERERDRTHLPGPEGDALEALQLLDRSRRH